MGAGFLYKLWQLCFLDVSGVVRALLGFNPLNSTGYEMQEGLIQGGTSLSVDMKTLYNNLFVPLALAFLITVVLILLIQKLTFEGITKEAGIKVFVGFMVSIIVISNGAKIATDIVNLSSTVGDQIYQGTSVQESEISEEVRNRVVGEEEQSIQKLNNFLKALDPQLQITQDSGGGFKFKGDSDQPRGIFSSITNIVLPSIVAALMLLVFAFGNFICILIVGITIITRMVEILLRTLGIPIAALEFALNGYNSSSMRYIKSFIAVAIQGVMIVLILWLKDRLQMIIISLLSTSTSGVYGGIIFILLSLSTVFAFTALISKSQQYAREVVGV
ncbi:hypothetical protein [uncultured Anaerococcus sp.]|uniref:hypothetical protein n=1 Tax=uncultured Anaerococcus sp. TaxID=293428 RepID=UPI0025D4081A|nr:hypothetical protein [uncultured Anaerococcus sp.]